MFIKKKNYYIIIEKINDFDLDLIRIKKKFNIIYRPSIRENFADVSRFRMKCKSKGVNFYVANDVHYATKVRSDGLYISSYNASITTATFKEKIGSAHNVREIMQKKKQGCKRIVFSRLFKTDYKIKKSYSDIHRFNLLNFNQNLIPLGGIRNKNLLKLQLVNSDSFVIMSEVKKKPAIISRLF